ncbi:MAG: ATP-binding protein [Candidatus Gastranaerophilaceae bacterium]
MIRKIIKIDTEKCNGCGLCVNACHEQAIGLRHGKAVLLRDDYCDGLGNCLPACPMNAISFEEREALAYDEDAVLLNKKNWPVQIKLAPVTAPYFHQADLLIAADCTAFTHPTFYQDFLRGRVTLIGCPKLDAIDYSEKLTEIFAGNEIRSITVTRMIVPCCGGLEYAIKTAIKASGKDISLRVVTIDTKGNIVA